MHTSIRLTPPESDYLPQEIQEIILQFLPVKTLSRCRSFCRRWKDLIDSDWFIQGHLAVQNPHLLIHSEYEQQMIVVDPRTLSFVNKVDPEKGKFTLLGIHHGVVCMYYGVHIVLWNPSISKSFNLPLPEYLINTYDNNSGPQCYGFWIDPSTKEFKILVMFFDFDADDDGEEYIGLGCLYSSIKHDWTLIAPEMMNGASQGSPLMIGGVAQWYFTEMAQQPGIKNVIMSFDFERDSFGFFEMPNLTPDNISQFQVLGNIEVVCWDASDTLNCDIFSMFQGLLLKKSFAYAAYVLWPLEMAECGRTALTVKEWDDIERAELVLYHTKGGFIVMVNVSCNFVESLLFPSL